MDTNFKVIKPKSKLANINVCTNPYGDESVVKIAKHAASSRGFQLPTHSKYTNLKETVLTGNDSNTPLNSNTSNIIKQSKRISYPKGRFITIKKMVIYLRCVMLLK